MRQKLQWAGLALPLPFVALVIYALAEWPLTIDHLSTATLFVGSWSYELKPAEGAIRRRPIEQHTNPGPPIPEAAAMTAAVRALGTYGLTVPAAGRSAKGSTLASAP